VPAAARSHAAGLHIRNAARTFRANEPARNGTRGERIYVIVEKREQKCHLAGAIVSNVFRNAICHINGWRDLRGDGDAACDR
jgi:hypothetical protein